jgi:hypothetical protein
LRSFFYVFLNTKFPSLSLILTVVK